MVFFGCEECVVKLQVAMDVLDLPSALTLAGKVAGSVDILELGTPLVKSAGIGAVSAIKAAHPDKLVFADMKTADAGALEAELAFDAGADLVTVMGAVDDATIRGAVVAVAGGAIYGADDPGAAAAELKKQATG